METQEDHKFEEFFRAYLATALWSSIETSEDGEEIFLDRLPEEAMPEETKTRLREVAKAFYTKALDLIFLAWDTVTCGPDFGPMGRAGHDLWLTQNGHGVGYWDGDWPEPQATELTKLAKEVGEINMYLGDDKKIYLYENNPKYGTFQLDVR